MKREDCNMLEEVDSRRWTPTALTELKQPQALYPSLLALSRSPGWKPGYESIPLENFWFFSQGGI